MRTTVFTIDRALPKSRHELAETIEKHLGNGEMVQVNDNTKPPGRRLRYTIQWIGEAGYVSTAVDELWVFLPIWMRWSRTPRPSRLRYD